MLQSDPGPCGEDGEHREKEQLQRPFGGAGSHGNAGKGNPAGSKPWAHQRVSNQISQAHSALPRNVPDTHISALCCALPNLALWGMHREEKCRREQLFVVCISFYPSV